MTLEDFFTLTELKDGLTTPARVNELLTVMQKEKESVVKNVGEATRQWSAVASTIASTENKDCLDRFIQLDGHWFLDRWLKDAQKFGNDIGNSFLEELIIALLRAVERLQIDNQRSVSSGIGRTVQTLSGHSSSVIRDKAKALSDRWMPPNQGIDAAPTDIKRCEAHGDETACASPATSPCRNNNQENGEQSQKIVSGCSDTVQQVRDKEETPTQDTIIESATTNPLDPVDSSCMNISGNLSVKIETHESKSETTCEDQSAVSEKYVEDVKAKQESESLDEAGAMEQKVLPLSGGLDDALESAIKTDTREDTSDKDADMVVDGGASPGHCHSTVVLNARSEVGDSSTGALHVSPVENPKATSDIESDEGSEDGPKHVGMQSQDDSGNGSSFSKSPMKAQDGDLVSKRPSDMELDYGMVDPLELARQVAIEVEREVDSRERSCSTSRNVSGDGVERPNSSDSTNEKERLSVMGSGKEVSSEPGPCPEGLPSGVDPVNDGETLVTRISEVAQESAPDAERGFSRFDLNQEVSSEEIDCPADPVSTPISVVSASRAAAADGLPVAPLQFEGSLGWKGSAATSAFRRIPEAEKTFSSSGSHNSSKQRLDRLDIDLNVAEGGEDKIEDFLSRNKMLLGSGVSGEEPQAEVSPRRLERLQLDLNSLGDGDADAVALDWKRDARVASLKQNGPQSPSLSSSSSSMQPSLRNIDLNLNDHFTVPNNPSSDNPSFSKLFNNAANASRGAYKQDESVISIFGKQVEVKRRDAVAQPNGRISDPAMEFSLGRAGSALGLGSPMQYATLPAYGHNGFSMSFSAPVYGPPGGPIPCMVDSRGAPIVPQIMGSSSPLQPAFSQPPTPFVFNMAAAGAPSGSNGAGPSRHGFDLNSGLMTEGGNRDHNGGLRQFFNHSQARSVDEHYLRASNALHTSSSSVLGGKRQEPDSGWEPSSINYKHQQPPWQ